jgi:predicted signal transduction protein with EAL and GGDEF domain
MEECRAALDRGEIDLWMASEFALITQTHYHERLGYKINMPLFVPMHSYLGFNKNEKVLCSIISKAQQFVATDVIETQWVGRAFDYSKKIAEQQAFFMAIFSGLLSLLLAATVFLFIRDIKLRKQLSTFANRDALTEIFNRRYFMELAIIQAERSYRTKNQCFLAIYDLDHFKSVNDEYGHLAGDKVLKETARRVKEAMRTLRYIRSLRR